MTDFLTALADPSIRPDANGHGNYPCVLLYHEVNLQPNALINRYLINLHPQVLNTHLTAIKRRFKPIGLDELIDAWESGQSVRDRVLVTFDDGYHAAVRYAAPILADLDLPSIWFVNSALWGNDRVFWLSKLMWIQEQGLLDRFVALANRRWPGLVERHPVGNQINQWAKLSYSRTLGRFAAEYISDHGFDETEIAGAAQLYASPHELRALSEVAELGNHSASHPNVARVSLSELQREAADCDAALRRDVGVQPRAFAFPFGEPGYHWAPSAIPALAPLGYRAIFSVENEQRLVSSGIWRGSVPRHTVPLGPATASEFTAYLQQLLSASLHAS